eukprot:scaffold41662_cov59-Phaeocystis_antarctica.AAC.3
MSRASRVARDAQLSIYRHLRLALDALLLRALPRALPRALRVGARLRSQPSLSGLRLVRCQPPPIFLLQLAARQGECACSHGELRLETLAHWSWRAVPARLRLRMIWRAIAAIDPRHHAAIGPGYHGRATIRQ